MYANGVRILHRVADKNSVHVLNLIPRVHAQCRSTNGSHGKRRKSLPIWRRRELLFAFKIPDSVTISIDIYPFLSFSVDPNLAIGLVLDSSAGQILTMNELSSKVTDFKRKYVLDSILFHLQDYRHHVKHSYCPKWL